MEIVCIQGDPYKRQKAIKTRNRAEIVCIMFGMSAMLNMLRVWTFERISLNVKI